LDLNKQDSGAGIDAFILENSTRNNILTTLPSASNGQSHNKKVSSKAVRQTIEALARSGVSEGGHEAVVLPHGAEKEYQDEEFVLRPSASHPEDAANLPTLHSLSSFPQSYLTHLFAPYTFFLSRETSRPIFEFIVRCFGGRIGWSDTSGSGSPFDETDDSITHVIIDRPSIRRLDETEAELSRRQQRKYVQPQWIVDCANCGKILLEEPYLQGKTLPPHLSPFGDREGAYVPRAEEDSIMDDEGEQNGVTEEDEPNGVESESERSTDEPLVAAMKEAHSNPAAIRAAELHAEAAGMDYGAFEKKVAKLPIKTKGVDEPAIGMEDMNKMMLSNKQRKLYEKIKYSERKRQTEVGSKKLRLMAYMANHSD
jgi:pescadillo protein